jgi:ABC-type hemin transport system substrate-binding protein
VAAGPQEALAVYRQALQLARQVRSPLDEARALEGTARCLARTGDRAAARGDLSEADAIFQRIGAAEAGPAAADLAAMKMSSGTMRASTALPLAAR